MILQESLKKQFDNIVYILAYKYGEELNNISSIKSLKNMYNKYISDLHKLDFLNPSTKITIELERSKKLLDIFNGEVKSSLDDRDQINIINDRIGMKKLSTEYNIVKEAIAEIETISKEHYILFQLIINEIFIFPAKGARGGSSSTGIGLIWANPKLDTPLNDNIEFMIHELTHNCMFIDEIRYGHYHYDEILKEETWAKSAILKTSRPLDKVIHSIVVSLEIILFREFFLGHPNKPKLHPPTPIMIEQIHDSIISVEKMIKNYEKPLVSDRVISIVENVKKNLSCYA